MAQPISTPMLIPRDILSAGEQVVFDKYKDQPAELAKRFTWWSMHDLMKYFHTQQFLTTLENDANMFAFQIDLRPLAPFPKLSHKELLSQRASWFTFKKIP